MALKLYDNDIKTAQGADLVKNTRQTIEHDGARISFEALSKQVGVSVDTLRKRYRKGKRGACLVAAPKTDCKTVYQGREMDLNELSVISGVPKSTLHHRYKKGARGDDLLVASSCGTAPKKFDIDGQTLTINDIAKKLGCHPDTLHKRYRNGLRGSDLLAPGTPGQSLKSLSTKASLSLFSFSKISLAYC